MAPVLKIVDEDDNKKLREWGGGLEYGVMVVDAVRVHWTGVLKHCSVRFETEAISMAEVRAI